MSTKLTVANQALMHRGRSRIAGYRGIAVGLPEKLNYAFNAETERFPRSGRETSSE